MNLLRSEVDLVIKECLALQHDPLALEKYMHDRQVMATAIMQHALPLRRWYDSRKEQTDCDKQAIVTKRRAEIYRRMNELGWEEKYYPWSKYVALIPRYGKRPIDPDNQKWFNYIGQHKELTEKTWLSLRPKLEELYVRFKERQANTPKISMRKACR